MSVIVGVDIAKNKFDYRIITEGNDRLSTGSCLMTHEGFHGFLADPNITRDAMFIMESTGLYHVPLLRFLNNGGYDVHCVNPLLIKKQVMADSLRKTKTDSADALSIAKYGRLHYDMLREQKSRMDDEVKAIARRRQQIVEDVARTKTQLKADLCVAWPEILSLDVFTATMLNFLSRFGCAGEVLAATDEDILAALSHKGKGRGPAFGVEDIRKLACGSIGVPYRSDMVKDSAEKLIHSVVEAKFLMLVPWGIFPCLCRPFPYLVCIFKAVCKQTPSCRSGNDLVAIEPGFDLSVIVERFLFGTTTYYFRSRERIVYTYTKNVRF